MTIRRNHPWGTAKPLPLDAPVAHDNASLRRLVSRQLSGAAPTTPIGLTGGDVWKVVGAPQGGPNRLASPNARTVSIDIISVRADGDQLWACAHAIARNSWWHGPLAVAMSIESTAAWRLAPAAHPNDGRLHVQYTGTNGTASMSLGQRVLASRRLKQGTHVPHPAVGMRRVREFTFSFGQPMGLWLDGERVGVCRELETAVMPDAATLVF